MVRTPQKNFLRAWREHRRLTQAKLAEMVGTTGAVISLLESGERGLSDTWLRKLAPALGTRPGHLLEVDPNEAPSDVLEIWEEIPEENRNQVREIMKTFRRKSLPEGVTDLGRLPRAPSDEAKQPKKRGGGEGPKGV